MKKYLILKNKGVPTNFDTLVDRYMHDELPKLQKQKIEALWDTMKASGRDSLSEEEEALFPEFIEQVTSFFDQSGNLR